MEEEKVETVDEEFDADPTFALYVSSPAVSNSAVQELDLDVLVNSLPSKPVQYELVVDASVSEFNEAELAMKKVERICESIDRMAESLLSLTINL